MTTDVGLKQESLLCDVHQVAEICRCSPRHVYRMADAGKMPRGLKLGQLVRWRRVTGDPRTGITDWILAGCPSCREKGGAK
jgi:predicted DNA-binding transcriptional regulator AlpA